MGIGNGSDSEFNILVGTAINSTSKKKLSNEMRDFVNRLQKVSTIKTKIQIDGQDAIKNVNTYIDAITKAKVVTEQFTNLQGGQLRNSKGQYQSKSEVIQKVTTHLEEATKSASALETEFNSLNKVSGQMGATARELAGGLEQVSSTTTSLKSGTESLTKTVSKWSDANGNVTKTITTLTDESGNVASAVTKTSEKMEQGASSAGDYNKAILEATGSTADLGVGLSNFLGTMAKVAEFQVITQILGSFQQLASDAVQSINDLDEALTDFKKVSDLSGDSLQEYAQQLGELGETVGRTRTEMVQSATNFKQAGYSDEDAKNLAKISEEYKNIADSELTSADSAGFLVSQMKAFGNDTEDFATHVIDSVNEVSNNFAVSSSDISSGLEKAGSALATTGNTFEQTIAMVSASTEVLRSSGKVSRGLRTIANNIANIANSAGQLQLKVKGTTKTIELFDKSTGDLKSTYDVFNNIYQYWNQMSNAEKQSLAISLAGKNQYEVFVTELDRFGDAQKMLTTALNSSGSAAKENAKRMDSIAVKTNLAKAQLQNFIFGNGGLETLAKRLLDVANVFLKFLNSPIGQFTSRSLLLFGVMKLMVALWDKSRTKLATNIVKLKAESAAKGENTEKTQQQILQEEILNTKKGKSIASLIRETSELKKNTAAKQENIAASQAQSVANDVGQASTTATKTATTATNTAQALGSVANAEATASTIAKVDEALETTTQDIAGVSTASVAAETAVTGLSGAATGLGAALGVVNIAMAAIAIAIPIITGLVDAWKKKQEELHPAIEKTKENLDNLKSSIESTQQAISDSNDKIKDLQNQINDLEKSGSNSADTQNKIAALKNQIELTKEQISLNKIKLQQEQQEAKQTAQKLIDSSTYKTRFTDKTLDNGDLQVSLEKKAQNAKGSIDEVVKHYETTLSTYSSFLKSLLDDYSAAEKQHDTKRMKQLDSQIKNYKDALTEEKGYAIETSEAIISAMENLSPDSSEYKKLQTVLNGLLPALQDTNNALGDTSNINDELSTSTSNASSALSGEADAASDASSAISDYDDSANNANNSSSDLQKTLQGLSSDLSNITSAHETLASAVKDYNDNGQITLDTLDKLVNLDPQYLACLINDNGQLRINEKSMEALYNAKLNDIKATIVASAKEQFLAIANGKAAVSAKVSANAHTTLKDVFNMLSGTTGSVASGMSEVAQACMVAGNAALESAGKATLSAQAWSTLASIQSTGGMNGYLDSQGIHTTSGKKQVTSIVSTVKKNMKEIKSFAGNLKGMLNSLPSYTSAIKTSTGATSKNTGGTGKNTKAKNKNSKSTDKNTKAIEKNKKAVEKLEKAQEKIAKKQQKKIDKVNSAWDALKDRLNTVSDIYDKYESALDDAFSYAEGKIDDLDDYATNTLSKGFENIKNETNTIADTFKTGFDKIYDSVNGKKVGRYNGGIENFLNLTSDSSFYSTKTKNTIISETNELGNDIKQSFEDSINDTLTEVETYVTNHSKKLGKSFTTKFFDSVKNDSPKLIKAAKAAFSDYVDDEILIKQLDSLYNAQKEANDKIMNEYKKQVDALNDAKKIQDDVYDNQIDSLNKQKDALSKVNDEISDQIELEEKQEALENARQKTLVTYQKGKGFVHTIDESAVKKAQQDLDSYNRQKQIDAIQDQIDKLNNAKDAYDKDVEAQVSAIEKKEDVLQKEMDKEEEIYNKRKQFLDDQLAEDKERYEQAKSAMDKFFSDEKQKISDAIDKGQEIIDKKTTDAEDKLIKKLLDIDVKSSEWWTKYIDNTQTYCDKLVKIINDATHKMNLANMKATALGNITDLMGNPYNSGKSTQSTLIKDAKTISRTGSTLTINKSSTDASLLNSKNRASSQAKSTSSKTKAKTYTSQAKAYQTARDALKYANSKSDVTKIKNIAKDGKITSSEKRTLNNIIKDGKKKKKYTGDASISSNGMYIVGDSPNKELVIGSKLNGLPVQLDKGTGVVNAKSTSTLAGLLNQFGTGTMALNKDNNTGKLNPNVTNNDNGFSINGGVTVNGANIHDAQSFANELMNLKNIALQHAYRR